MILCSFRLGVSLRPSCGFWLRRIKEDVFCETVQHLLVIEMLSTLFLFFVGFGCEFVKDWQGSFIFRNSINPGFSRAVLSFFPGLFQGS